VIWFKLLYGIFNNSNTVLALISIPDLRLSWVKTREQIENTAALHSMHWHTRCSSILREIGGIMSLVIGILFCVGFYPLGPDVWRDPAGETWHFCPGSPAPLKGIIDAILFAFHGFFHKYLVGSFDFEGAENGVSWDITLSCVRGLRKKNKDPSTVGAIETLLGGGCVPPSRALQFCSDKRDDVNDDVLLALCPRCGEPNADSWHTYWKCPHNLNIGGAVQESEHLCEAALEEIECPAYWNRGLMPAKFLETPPHAAPLQQYDIHYTPGLSPLIAPGEWPSGDYFGDGSGGVDTAIPVLRRCGSAVCVYGDTGPILTASTPLPGEEQTVYRAELYALILAVELVELNGFVNYFIDNQAVHDTFHKGKDRALMSQAADLFDRLFAVIRFRNITLDLKWMPSHLNDPEKAKKVKVPGFVTPWHIDGNVFIDNVATQAAALHRVSSSVADPILKRVNNLKLIQLRIAAIIKDLPSRKKRISVPPVPRRSLEGAMATSRHSVSLTADSKSVCCLTCHSTISLKASHLYDFLDGSCQIPIKNLSVVAIGKQHSHPSHPIVLYGGVYLCTACGCVGRAKLRHLAGPCHSMPTSSSRKSNLDAFCKGGPLPGMPGWPFPRQAIALPNASNPKMCHEDATAFHRVTAQVNRIRAQGLGEDHFSDGSSSSD